MSSPEPAATATAAPAVDGLEPRQQFVIETNWSDTPAEPGAPLAPADATSDPQPDGEKPVVPATADTTPSTAAPAAATSDQPGDADLDKLINDPRVQARIDRLAANRAGNLRAAEQKESAEWAAADKFYTEYTEKVEGDKELATYYATSMDPDAVEVRRFLENYDAGRKAREARDSQTQSVDVDALRATHMDEFNVGALQEFKGTLAKSPVWGHLTEQLKKDITAGKHNGESWFSDYVDRIGADLDKAMKRVRDSALEAGRNEQAANTQGAPIVITPGGPSMSPLQIITAHMNGRNFSEDVLQGAYKALNMVT